MSNNIPPGISCNWNGQRWTPTVTNLQEQWAAQTPPGIARGKVWQPKAAPPAPPAAINGVDLDDISDENLTDAIAGGFPLDLSTFRTHPQSRQVESPLDLSLKTRKRCADSTILCQQYAPSGKKMCLLSNEKQSYGIPNASQNYVHNTEAISRDYHGNIVTRDQHPVTLPRDLQSHTASRDLHSHTASRDLHSHTASRDLHSHTISRDLHSHTISRDLHSHTVSRDHPHTVSRDIHPHTVSRDSHPQRHLVQNIDPVHMKHNYSTSSQHLQNIQTIQSSNTVFQNHPDVRQRYASQTNSRQLHKSASPHMLKESHQQISNSSPRQHRTEVSKYSITPENISREYTSRDRAKYCRQQDVLSGHHIMSPLVRETYHVTSQVQKPLQHTSTTSSRYIGNHSAQEKYQYLRNSPVVPFNQSVVCASSRSPSLKHNRSLSPSVQQNRPSVLSGGLHFKQPQECCSPDSTFVMTSSAESQSQLNYNSRSLKENSQVVARDIHPPHYGEKCDLSNVNKVSSTSYTPSSSPRGSYFSNSPNMISCRKSPSNKSLSKLTSSRSNTPESSPIMQQSIHERSIIIGTSSSKTNDFQSETVIRNPRPRLWNPDQSKQNMWKCEENSLESDVHKSDIVSNKQDTQLDTSNISSDKTVFTDPLEIAIPNSKNSDHTSEHKPKPFSKKHIIMNAFRNDESMKHIREEQKASKPLQKTDSMRSPVAPPEKVVRSQDGTVFISPESPKMPTLSPQQKLPAPKVSPLMGEPPTLDIASAQGNRRKQNKVSPCRKSQLKHSGELEQHKDNQDYSIQPQSNFPQRLKLPYKKIPVANVAPMIHGRCNTVDQDSDKPSQDIKQFMSVPTPQPIQAFRVSASVVVDDFDVKKKEQIKPENECVIQKGIAKNRGVENVSKQIPKDHKIGNKHKTVIKEKTKNMTTLQTKIPETCYDGKHYPTRAESEMEANSSKVHSNGKRTQMTANYRCEDNKISKRSANSGKSKSSKRKTRIISNTKRKADEIRRRARERKCKGRTGCNGRRIRKRFHLRKQRGFIDFQPEVLETRTRRKSAGRRGYHRNAAYENELWREEKRKAVRHRQRVRRFNKRLSLKAQEQTHKEVITVPQNPEENIVDPTVGAIETNDDDTSGTWEVKNTSTMLRNGKSKGALSMKLLFRPPERRQFRRRVRKRGRIRYGLRKAVSARAKLLSYTPVVPEQDYPLTPLSRSYSDYQAGFDVHSAEYSEYDFDQAEFLQQNTPLIPSLPEIKKLSVCKDTGETILHRAARMGYEDKALSYLQTGTIDVNVRDNAGYTPLHESCVSGNMVIARMLLSYGAIVNCASQDGIRPIHDAVDNDFVSMVRLLLSYGADPTISTYGGKTPIKIAHSQKMRSLLQGYMGDINGFNKDTEESVWEFHASDSVEGNDVFDDIPSDPEMEPEEDIFQESSSPMFHQLTVTEPISNERSPVVLLKDVSDFLHVKTGDILKDKIIKSVLIEDGKDSIDTSSNCSCHYERIQNIIETNCRLLNVRDLHLVFSKFEKNKSVDKDKRTLEKKIDQESLSSAISVSKSPKHKPFSSRSHHDS